MSLSTSAPLSAPTSSSASELLAIEKQYGAHNYHPLPIVVERAQGVWVYDTAGKRYLDCLSAYSALNQGHAHPTILAALFSKRNG